MSDQREDELWEIIHDLREKLYKEEKTVRIGAFFEMFLHLSREEQDGCIKFMEDFPRRLRLLQKQQDEGKILIKRD